MKNRFEVVTEFNPGKHVRNTSILNIYKHMILQRVITPSTYKNFLLMIYFLYYRITLEFGISMLNRSEKLIVIVVFALMLFSFLNLWSRIIANVLKRVLVFTSDIIWIYKHIDEIKRLRKAL